MACVTSLNERQEVLRQAVGIMSADGGLPVKRRALARFKLSPHRVPSRCSELCSRRDQFIYHVFLLLFAPNAHLTLEISPPVPVAFDALSNKE